MTVVYTPGYLVNKIAGNGVSGFGGDGGPATSASLSLPRDVAIDRNGNLYIVDRGNNRIRKVSPDGIIRTVVGGDTAGFSGDGGPAPQARINGPNSVAFDDAGSFYFTDIENFRIRKVAANGIITTVAGNGMQGFSGDGGPAPQARLGFVIELAVDSIGDIYAIDNNRIRKITVATGVINTIAGTGQNVFSGDGGPAAAASFAFLADIAIDRAGNIYALDNNRLRKIDTNGVVNTIAGTGEFGFKGDGGPAVAAQFYGPKGVALDDAGNLYIADFFNERIRKIDTAGIITSIAGGGGADPPPDGTPATNARILADKVTVDTAGRVYYHDSLYVRRCAQLAADLQAPTISITSPNPASTYGDISGTTADNQAVSQVTWKNDRGEFGQAEGTTSWTIRNLNSHLGQTIYTVTAWDAAGNAGSATVTVRYQPKPLATRVAGAGERGTGEENDSSANSRLWRPETVVVDSSGVLYITDTGNHRIRKVGRDGRVTTFAGSGQIGGSGDGGPGANATMNAPSGIALDPAGNVYIADTNNHRVRKVSPAGVISAVAGTGIEGFDGDGGQAVNAQLSTPVGLAADAAGNLYIADAGNNRVRKVALTTGVITTVAGSGFGFSGDGGAAVNAQLFFPTGVALDKAGNLFIADTGNHRIRKVSPAGVINTIAGVGTAGLSGDGGAAISAQLNSPGGLTFDIAGNLYFADQLNHVVRRITPGGLINKVAGVGQPGAGLDGFEAETTHLNSPAGVAVDGAGNLFIADTGNHRVLVVAAYRGLANASAASFVASVGSSEMIIAAFGTGLATRTEGATSLPLPVSLAGTSVKARDSRGNERTASLFFVSSTQVNYQIPPGMAFGRATVTINSGAGTLSTGSITIEPVAPGLFTASADGQGVAAAVALRIKNDGSQIYEPVVFFDQSKNKFVALPIDLGPDLGSASDQVFLILFGTGVRNRSSLSTAIAQIGGENAQVLFAGAQGSLFGLDQVNVRLPRSLAGRGVVDIVMTVDGKTANTVSVNVK